MLEIKEDWIHFTVARTDLPVTKMGRVERKEKRSKLAAKVARSASG